jgi:hypothetical protein
MALEQISRSPLIRKRGHGFDGARRTIQGYEAIHMIRKGQVRRLSKGNIAKQVRFIKVIFGLVAA